MQRKFIAILPVPILAGVIIRSDLLHLLLIKDSSPRHTLYQTHPWMGPTSILLDCLAALAYALFYGGIWWCVRHLKKISALSHSIRALNALKLFIIASAATSLSHIVTIWWPFFLLSTILKIICAAASLPAAILFVWQAPALIAAVGRFFALLAAEQASGESIRKVEAFLDRTNAIAGVGGWELDLATGAVTWSKETRRIHGVPPDYVPTLERGLQFYDLEARAAVVAAVKRTSNGGEGWDLEVPVTTMDGRHIRARTVGVAECVDGRPVRIVGAFQDVTAEVAQRRELQRATDRVKLATDSGRIGIWDWNIVTNELECDPWMYRIHGKDPRDAASDSLWRDHLHPDDRASVEQALKDALDGNEDYDIEFRILWKDGSTRYIRGTAQVTRDERGRPLRMVGANWDITESRRLNAALAGQHETLQVTLQSIGDGVITTDRHRNVAWMNPAAERMTGWSTVDAIGIPLNHIFRTLNEDSRAPVENPSFNRLVQGKTMGIAQHTLLVSRDGSEFGIENSVAPIRNNNGLLLGNVLVFRDVTEQRRLAAETEHVNRLQLQLKLKDEFLSHVSHELRSPLTSIYSFTSIICDGLAGETTPDQTEYLHIILKNVVQLQAMIEDLLTVTQSREGKLSVDPQPCAATEAVEDAINAVQGNALTKHVHLSANFSAAIDGIDLPHAWADPTRLRQILIILIDNAVKFTPEGGHVSVTVSEQNLGYLLLQVTDTGCGIPPEMRTRVFENLYQIPGPGQPDTSKAGRTGLGLGLHIARNLVTRQGGNIWITASSEGGSVFNFTLPIYADQKDDTGEPDAALPSRRKTDRLPVQSEPLSSAA